jgi:hypothetical protein
MATAAQINALIDELAAYRSQFESARGQFDRLIAGIDDGKFNWRPVEDQWSIAECIDHLIATGTLMNRNIDDGIERALARDLRSDGPFKYGAIGNWFVKAVGPSDEARKRKFKAPKAYTPTSNHTISRLKFAFNQLQDEYSVRIERANGLDLARVKVPSAAGGVAGLVRLSLGQWFALLANHQDRHLAQARDVRAAMEANASQS